MFVLNPFSNDPIFEQIKKQIIKYIEIGIYKADDKLPSVRSLASDLAINPNTVQKAYSDLENEGYIYTINKKGVFISSDIEIDKQKYFNTIKLAIDEALRIGVKKEEIANYLKEEVLND